jgi:hypothetical protein
MWTFLFPIGRKTWGFRRWGLFMSGLLLLTFATYLAAVGPFSALWFPIVALALLGLLLVTFAFAATDTLVEKVLFWGSSVS